MKRYLTILAASTAVLASASATAANSVTLQITGKIKASACSIRAMQNNIDFGNVERGMLNRTATTPIGSRLVSVAVDCDANSLISLRIDDNKSHKLASRTGFRFDNGGTGPYWELNPDAFFSVGGQSSTQPIGAAAIRIGLVSVDGTPRGWIAQARSPDQLPGTLPSVFQFVTPGAYFSPSISQSAYTNVIGKSFVFPLDVAVAIDRSSNLPNTADVELGGSLTVSVHYI